MLLSVKPPPSMQNGFKLPHEYSTLTPSSSRYSPPESPRTLPSVFDSAERMSSHRGLPPPAGMQLPPPDRGSSTMATLGSLPAPPSQWPGQDHPDSMRNWLSAKAEEDRRKQEEEKTRQETMRLDQRKIEQSMLRESLQGGIPPVMVPLIFAGMGGGNLPSQTLEWAQHYMSQMTLQNQNQNQNHQQQQQQIQVQQQQQQAQQQQQQQQQHQHQQQQQQQQHVSPDIRRDGRMIPPNPYGGHQNLQPAQPPPAQPPLQQLPPPPRQSTLGAPTSGPRPPTSSGSLARLNTTETQAQIQNQHADNHAIQPQIGGQQLIHPHPQALQPAQPQVQVQQLSSQNPHQQELPSSASSASAPGIFFHHWTPPNPASSPSVNTNGQPTPSGKSTHGSPFGQSGTHSHLRSEYQSSPKKRKTAPTSVRRGESRDRHSFSRSRSREGGVVKRQGSIASARAQSQSRRNRRESESGSSEREREGRNLPRPSSRQQRMDEEDERPGRPEMKERERDMDVD